MRESVKGKRFIMNEGRATGLFFGAEDTFPHQVGLRPYFLNSLGVKEESVLVDYKDAEGKLIKVSTVPPTGYRIQNESMVILKEFTIKGTKYTVLGTFSVQKRLVTSYLASETIDEGGGNFDPAFRCFWYDSGFIVIVESDKYGRHLRELKELINDRRVSIFTGEREYSHIGLVLCSDNEDIVVREMESEGVEESFRVKGEAPKEGFSTRILGLIGI